MNHQMNMSSAQMQQRLSGQKTKKGFSWILKYDEEHLR